MKPHLASAKKPSTETDLFATLRVFLRAEGTSAPSAPRRLALSLLLAATAVLALIAAPASARTYETQLTEANGIPFTGPEGLAVDGSDNLWVSDSKGQVGPGLMDKFDSSGKYVLQGSGEGHWTGQYTQSIAFSNASGHLYVADSNHGDLWVLNTNGTYNSDIKGAGRRGYIDTTADNSAGPTGGDVYVSTEHGLFRIDGAGNPAPFSASAPYIEGAELTGTPTGPFGNATFQGLAVDPATGDLYYTNTVQGVVDKFAPSGEFLQQITEANGEPFGSVSAIAVDPTNGNLLVVDPKNQVIDEFNHSGESLADPIEGKATPSGSFGAIPYVPHGLAVDSSGRLYVSDATHAVVDVFGPAGPPGILPKATYKPLSALAQTSVTLGAEADPNGGGEIKACVFEYGKTKAYGESAACSPAPPYASPAELSAGLSGLTPSTLYHYRLLLTNAHGTRKAPDQSFRTTGPPTIDATSTSGVSGIAATIEAQINPSGFDTHYWIEYGTSEGYGSETAHGDIGFSSVDQATSNELTGLNPSTTYHYRLVAENSQKTTKGPDQTFETEPAAQIKEQSVSHITRTCATLDASVNPDGSHTHVFFQYGTEAGVYGSETTPADIGSSNVAQQTSAEVCGLTLGTTYHFRAVGENSQGTVKGKDQAFETEPALSIDSTFVSAVTATEATLNAQINPLGLATTYHFEYLTEAKYQENHESFTGAAKAPEPDAALGFTDNKDHPAAATLTGLSPETSYRYRVLATNEAAPQGIPGPTHAFATRPPGFGSLPDGRVYEAVSPVATEGHAQVFVPSAGDGFFDSNGAHGIATAYPLEVAPDGEAVIYEGDTPPTGGTSDAVYASGNAYLSTRSPGGGWNPLNINPPEATYRAFSNDLSVGVLSSKEPPSGVGPPNTDDFYAHPTAAGEGGEYRPLFTKTAEKLREPTFAGMNAGTAAVPASSHLLFQADQALLEAGPLQTELAKAVEEVLTAKQEPKALYDSVAGHPSLISVLPNGKPDASAVFGSPVTIEAAAISEALGGSHVISADGSRVFWSSVEDIDSGTSSVPKALYVRENDTQPPSALSGEECTEPAKACTVQLDAAEPGAPGPGGGARFLAASADGSRVFFTDDASAGLTKDTVSGSGQNLYEYDFGAPEGKRLTDLTAAPGADVQGVLGAGEDGSYLYFAAGGVLAKNKNGNGEEAAPQTCQPSTLCNVYLLHEGATTFIATLFGGDGIGGVIPFDLVGAGNANAGDWAATAGYRTAEVTPDGRSLVFMSGRSLTGYDNRSLDEVFLYQAGAGTISCVSCNPTGEPPLPGGILASEHNGETLGAYIPITKNDTYRPQPRVVSDDGSRVFFVSNMPLVPQDTNGAFDVYEWERDGTGSCHRAQGCVYLLSGGTEAEHSYLLGAGASGRDVFIITRDRLVPQDQNENFDVYDVREGGVPAPPEPIICTGEGCREAGAKAPAAQSPGSASFSGPEEDASHPQKPTCRKGFVKKHGHCVKQHSKKHHKKHKRANGNRGGQK